MIANPLDCEQRDIRYCIYHVSVQSPLDRGVVIEDVYAKPACATLSRYDYPRYDAPTCRCDRGKHIRATTSRARPGQAGCIDDRWEIDTYVGPLLANRIPTARRVVATAAAAAAIAGVPARARRIRIGDPGNVASQKSILVHRLLVLKRRYN